MRFWYDAAGNRVIKRVHKTPTTPTLYNNLSLTYYVRDAAGNTMGTYQQQNYSSSGWKSRLLHQESALYGSSRLGLYQPDSVLLQNITFNTTTNAWTGLKVPVAVVDTVYKGFAGRRIGRKQYELNDHLGNVRAVVSDAKKADSLYYDNTFNLLSFTLKANLLSSFNYYPGGMLQPGGEINLKNYRYGFGGHEKDDEVKGSSNHYSFGDYGLDPRLNRRWNRDPKESKFASLTPYQVFGGVAMFYWRVFRGS